MSGTVGEIEYAKRRALAKLDEWNDETAAVPKFTSTYYELQGVVEDAVHCGFQRALGEEKALPSEGGERASLGNALHDLLVHGDAEAVINAKAALADHGISASGERRASD